MGQKVNPHGMRVGVIKDWDSRWYASNEKVGDLLVEDKKIRDYLKKNLYNAQVPKIEIERSNGGVTVYLHCARPGMVIGKEGKDIEATRLAVEKMIGNLREQQGKWQVKDDLAISADTLAKISFKLSVDGKEVENGGSDDFAVQPGKTSLIEGFSDQLLGHKAGEKFVIKATFPTPYHNAELAGKEGTFDVTVNSVSERILPEVDADFVRIYGIKDGNLDAFRDALRKNMQRELKKALYAKTRESLFDALTKQYEEVEVPASLVAEEVKRLQENMKKNIQAQFGFTPKEEMLKAENFSDQAKANVLLGFILRAFVSELKIGEPSKEMIDGLISQYAEAFETPEEVIKSIAKDKKAMSNFVEEAYEHNVVDALMEKACDGETVLSFEEITHK